jgi:very-short-patch-repair endonuclease
MRTMKRTVAPPRPRIAPKRKGPDLEALFALQLRATGLPTPVKQHKFHPKRKWLFDFAWPELKIAVEIEGGTYTGGRHVRPEGFREDAIKYNNATMLGWSVYRFTSDMVKKGDAIDFIKGAFNG